MPEPWFTDTLFTIGALAVIVLGAAGLGGLVEAMIARRRRRRTTQRDARPFRGGC